MASERVQRGGGRPQAPDREGPNLLLEFHDLVSPGARGDPMSPLRWTAKSTYHLSDALGRMSRLLWDFGDGPTAVQAAA